MKDKNITIMENNPVNAAIIGTMLRMGRKDYEKNDIT